MAEAIKKVTRKGLCKDIYESGEEAELAKERAKENLHELHVSKEDEKIDDSMSNNQIDEEEEIEEEEAEDTGF